MTTVKRLTAPDNYELDPMGCRTTLRPLLFRPLVDFRPNFVQFLANHKYREQFRRLAFVCLLLLAAGASPLGNLFPKDVLISDALGAPPVRNQTIGKRIKENVQLSPFFMFQSQRIVRGAQFYPYPWLVPFPQLTLFNHLEVRGPGMAWNFFDRSQPLQLEVGARHMWDGRPLLALGPFDEGNDYRAGRKRVTEAQAKITYRFGFRQLFKIGAEFAQDLHTHGGRYGSLFYSVPFLPFTSLKGSTGMADSAMAEWLYGPGAQGGFADQKLSMQLTIPLIIGGLLQVEGGWSWILHSNNRVKERVQGDSTHLFAALRVITFIDLL